MPCYLFTYHAYRSWLPDRPQGYVRRGEGILPTDHKRAKQYAKAALEELVEFHAEAQRVAIDTLREAVTHIGCRVHFVSTDGAHIHALVSWRGPRTWLQNRNSIKRSLTIQLKRRCGRRTWLSEGASRKRVRDPGHFDYLVGTYLPRHVGWKWGEEKGLFR
ncbi:MAG: hypothetical protein AB7G28_02985 [Pirellulales bacterium]